MLVESVSVLDEHAALTEEAQQDVGGPGTHHLSSNTLSSCSQTSTCEVIKNEDLKDRANMPRIVLYYTNMKNHCLQYK